MVLICKCGTEIIDKDIEYINGQTDEGGGYIVEVTNVECTCSGCKSGYDAGAWYHIESMAEAKELLAIECEELTIKPTEV